MLAMSVILTLYLNHREVIGFLCIIPGQSRPFSYSLIKLILLTGKLFNTFALIMCYNQSMSHRAGYSCIHTNRVLCQKLNIPFTFAEANVANLHQCKLMSDFWLLYRDSLKRRRRRRRRKRRKTTHTN